MLRHRVSHLRFLIVLAAAVGALTLVACENNRTKLNEKQAAEGLGLPDSQSDGNKHTLPQRCPLDELVVDPKPDTPDWAIMQTLQAALDATTGHDDATNFQKFFAQFAAGNDENRIKMDYWGRAKQHVTKYLQGDAAKGMTFKICERREEPSGETKIFIQSLDPKKSNPPYRLKKNEQGAWKITFHPI